MCGGSIFGDTGDWRSALHVRICAGLWVGAVLEQRWTPTHLLGPALDVGAGVAHDVPHRRTRGTCRGACSGGLNRRKRHEAGPAVDAGAPAATRRKGRACVKTSETVRAQPLRTVVLAWSLTDDEASGQKCDLECDRATRGGLCADDALLLVLDALPRAARACMGMGTFVDGQGLVR